MTDRELKRLEEMREDESNDREQMRLEGLEIEEDDAEATVDELLQEDSVEVDIEKIVTENRNLLESLVKQFEGYKFRFFVFGTNNFIINLKTNEEVTPEELMNSDQNFQIKDANYSEEHKIVEIDVVLFPK